jgi:hypothetical protein
MAIGVNNMEKEMADLKQLDEFLNELEYKDPTEAPTTAQQMKGQLIKNIGVQGATVQDMGDETYQLTFNGKKEKYDFENLIKRLVEIATGQAQNNLKTAAPTPPAPAAPAPTAAAPAPAAKSTGPAQVQV